MASNTPITNIEQFKDTIVQSLALLYHATNALRDGNLRIRAGVIDNLLEAEELLAIALGRVLASIEYDKITAQIKAEESASNER